MSNIRVTYSGLISFVISLSSVFTGLIFTIIVTRQLTQDEFGTWGIVGAMTGYVLILDPIVSYWTTREIARDQDSGKTALISSGMFSSIAIAAYIGIVVIFESHIEVDLGLLLFATMLIPLSYIRSVLQSVSLGYKPEIRSFGIIAFEITKIPVGLFLIYFLDLGLMGAILTVAIATTIAVIVIGIKIRSKIQGSFQKIYLKNWLKRFWIPTYPKISNRIMNLDVVAFTILAGSIGDLAYWTAANAVSKMVAHAGQISSPIYGKLLSGGKIEYVQENVVRTLYFAFPLVSIAIIFSQPALFILNPLYEIAAIIVMVMSIVVFFQTLNGLWESALTGIENVDLNEKATPKDFLKSKLFALPTLRLIQRSIYLISLCVVFILFSTTVENKIELIFYWSIVALVTQIPLNIYLYILIKRHIKPKIPLIPIFKYLFSSVFIFGLTYLLMNKYLEYKISIFEFLPEFLIFVSIGIGGYLGFTYIIDNRTRLLFKSIINELFKKS